VSLGFVLGISIQKDPISDLNAVTSCGLAEGKGNITTESDKSHNRTMQKKHWSREKPVPNSACSERRETKGILLLCEDAVQWGKERTLKQKGNNTQKKKENTP
jgi:hypothetical protein